jgi:enterochelin esterase-like enzyme
MIVPWVLGGIILLVCCLGLVGVYQRWWDVDLTAGWVLGVLAVLFVAAITVAGFTWDRPRYRGLRRSGLLLAIQVLAMATLAAMVNMAGGFYGSMSELLGVHRGGAAVLADGAGGGGGGGGGGDRGGGKGAGAVTAEPWLADARQATGPGRGVWAPLTISGRRTGYALPAWAYVPDAYFDTQQPTRRFPVVILLAGYPGAVENWERQGHMVAVLDKLMAQGTIPPMILVSVTQNPDAARDSECVDATGGAHADSYITEDVPEALAQHLRVQADRSAWSLMGYSTGGYCAVDLALRHPRQFSAAVSLDGYFEPAVDATTGDLFHNDVALRRAYTPTQTIHDHRDAPLRFDLVVGDAEPKLKQAAKDFATATRTPDVATVVDIPGGHNWTTWTNALPAALTWLTAGR